MQIVAYWRAASKFFLSPSAGIVYLNGIAYTMIGVGFWQFQPGLFVPGLLLWFDLFMELRNARTN